MCVKHQLRSRSQIKAVNGGLPGKVNGASRRGTHDQYLSNIGHLVKDELVVDGGVSGVGNAAIEHQPVITRCIDRKLVFGRGEGRPVDANTIGVNQAPDNGATGERTAIQVYMITLRKRHFKQTGATRLIEPARRNCTGQQRLC